MFRVKVVHNTVPVTYTITDFNGKGAKRNLYEEELQKFGEPQHNKIEEILKRRWLSYGKEFDSWISKNDFTIPND